MSCSRERLRESSLVDVCSRGVAPRGHPHSSTILSYRSFVICGLPGFPAPDTPGASDRAATPCVLHPGPSVHGLGAGAGRGWEALGNARALRRHAHYAGRVRGLLIGLGVAVVLSILAIVVLSAAGRRSAARELITLIPNLLVLFRGLFADGRVSRGSKLLLGVGIVWLSLTDRPSPPSSSLSLGRWTMRSSPPSFCGLSSRHTGRSVLEEHWRGGTSTLDLLAGRG